MTNKILTLTDRQLDIIKSGFGLLGIQVVAETVTGEDPTLNDETITIDELRELVEVLDNPSEETVAAESKVTLTNVEKFLISSGLGGVLRNTIETAGEEVTEAVIGDQVRSVTEKLELLPGAVDGAVEFLAQIAAKKVWSE